MTLSSCCKGSRQKRSLVGGILGFGIVAAIIAAAVIAWRRFPRPETEYDKRMKEGQVCADRGDFNAAIAAYGEAIRLDPQSADAYFNKGFAYGQKGDYDKAIEDFNASIRLHPKNARAIPTGALPTRRRAISTRRSPTSTMPPNSIPEPAGVWQPRHRLRAKGPVRQGDRQFHQGHPFRSAIFRSLFQPWLRPLAERRDRAGDRRLHQGHPVRSGIRRRLFQPRLRRPGRRASTTR